MTAAAATQLVVSTQPLGSVTAGNGFGFVVSAEDAHGNLDLTFNGSVTVVLASNPGGSTLGGTLTVNARNGVATFSTSTRNKTGTFTLQAISSGPSAMTTNGINVTAASASQLVFSTQPPDSVPAGEDISSAIVVNVYDQFGNLATSDNTDQVTISASGPGSFDGSSTTTVTVSGGVAIFVNLILDTTGTYTLQANATGLRGDTSRSFAISPAAADRLIFDVLPGNVLASSTISPAVKVDVIDPFGNLLTSDNTDQVSLSVASGPGGFTAGSTTSVTVSAGVATFGNLSLSKSGAYTLMAASNSDLIFTTAFLSVLPAPQFKVILAPVTPGNSAAGQPFNVTISAILNGKLDTSYAGTVVLTSSDPHVPSSAVTFLSGDGGSESLTLDTPGKQTVTVVDTSLPSARGTSNVVSVTGSVPLSIDHFLITGLPASDITGAAHLVTITAVNAAGKTVPNYTGTVQLTSSDSYFLPIDVPFTLANRGVAMTSVALNSLGTQSLTATDGSGITGTESNILVFAPLAVFASATNVVAGGSVTITVSGLTASNLTDTLFADDLQLTTSDPRARCRRSRWPTERRH